MILDFETIIDRKQDFSAALEILCEEFRQADEAKTTKKRSKRKPRRANKTVEVSVFSPYSISICEYFLLE